MESIRVSKEACFTLSWRIKNFYQLGRVYMDKIYSPEFEVFNMKWQIIIEGDKYYIDIILNILDDNIHDRIRMFFELLCVKADGNIESLYVTDNDFRRKIIEVLSREKSEEMYQKGNIYFPNGNFTLRFRLVPDSSIVLSRIECFALTQVEMKTILFQKKISNINDIKAGQKILIPSSLVNIFKVFLIKGKGENNDENLSIALHELRLIKWTRFHLKLKILNLSGIPLDDGCIEKDFVFWPEETESDLIELNETIKKAVSLNNDLIFQIEVIYDADVHTSIITENEFLPLAAEYVDEAPKSAPNTVICDLKTLYTDKSFTDVHLKTGEDSLPAHKAILCARSPVFAAMFSNEMLEKQNGVVPIEDIDVMTLNRLLLFMYTDILDDLKEEESTMNLLSAADKYQITSLKKKCAAHLRSKISLQNVLKILQFADLHQEDMLKKASQEFICCHHSAILTTEKWRQFICEQGFLVSDILAKLSTKYAQLEFYNLF